MSDGSQAQRAGSHSQQIQVAGNLVMGVTEERAREIAQESYREMSAQISAESHVIASERVEKLDEKFIKQLATDGLLDALGDPAFQVTLRKAQLGAASTERESDYELLASLLHDRAARPTDRPVRAGINRAVEIVDQLDDEALNGLTVFQTVTGLLTANADLDNSLDMMEKVLEQVMSGKELPHGTDWLENLDVLDAIRIDRITSFLEFSTFWSDRHKSMLSAGLLADSEDDARGRAKLAELTAHIAVVPHELKPGYNRFPMEYAEKVVQMMKDEGVNPADADQVLAIGRDIYGAEQKDEDLLPAFMEQVRMRPNLSTFEKWWGTFEVHFTVTSVGRVVARANARNLDALGIIPPLS